MITDNKIEEKNEHSQRLEILNQNSNVALFRVILGLIKFLAFHDHHQWKCHEIFARERKNKSEKRKKNEEQLREKERKEFDPKA